LRGLKGEFQGGKNQTLNISKKRGKRWGELSVWAIRLTKTTILKEEGRHKKNPTRRGGNFHDLAVTTKHMDQLPPAPAPLEKEPKRRKLKFKRK